jgi:cytochrome c oxidase subunit II
MAISSPSERIWWKEPIHKVELIWIVVAFLWGLVMFFMMIWWHAAGEQNLSNEAYRTTPGDFAAKVDKMIEAHTVRQEGAFPVVRPPPGSDVYMMGRLYMWWPMLELQKGASYRLHLSSIDLQHGFSLQPVNINIQVHPGYEHVLKITPNQAGEYGIVCNEYCGLGHHTMTGRIYVVDGPSRSSP